MRRRPRAFPLHPHSLPLTSAARSLTTTTITAAAARHLSPPLRPGNAAFYTGRAASPEAVLLRPSPATKTATATPSNSSMLPLARCTRPQPLTSTRTFLSAHLLQIISGHSRQPHRNAAEQAQQRRSRDPQIGLATVPADAPRTKSKSPFYFEAGWAGWAKRPSRPFPPPFFSPPSGSFSDPLSTHNRARARSQPSLDGELLRGVTNGDDAMLVSDHLIGTNDGVGAWAQRERGHAPLWSRLLMHFWAMSAEQHEYRGADDGGPDPVRYLDEAYAATKQALSPPNNEWHGTTTACVALLDSSTTSSPSAGSAANSDDNNNDEDQEGPSRPVLYVTQLGDCKCLVLRPADRSVLFSTEEQWHYFDCPRQLGTNSPDTPRENAVLSRVDLLEGDMVLAMSDGVTDNLWEGEIVDAAVDAMTTWTEMKRIGDGGADATKGESWAEGMRFVAQELVLAARKIAEDPFATSPFMERAVDEGLAIEGGKMDDISVVAALCKKRKGR